MSKYELFLSVSGALGGPSIGDRGATSRFSPPGSVCFLICLFFNLFVFLWSGVQWPCSLLALESGRGVEEEYRFCWTSTREYFLGVVEGRMTGATAKNEKNSHDSHHEDKNPGLAWLLFCAFGMISSLTMYGIVLEYATSGGRKLHEISFVFVTTTIYTITAYVARWIIGEKPTNISKYQMLVLSVTSIASTFTSVRSLRYVIYPVQVLFKSCKPVPVMIFGVLLGKKYPLRKYVNVIIITCGVALFMGGGNSTNSGGGMAAESTLLGALMLSVSLCFDGATGAYEDKLMGKDHVGPFDLMYNIQLGKAVISFLTLVAVNELGPFIQSVQEGGLMLLLLGFTGALGQVIAFVLDLCDVICGRCLCL